ncbi:hypothetical protein EMPS_10804 [Entomortierella parvispora]|uniref:Uncharacterized protein n=1 Tax=Entomortierella parvispora TaxID=205924 RepID=A0A9P3M1W1_9FUNG|nr:hypothetical protein EMPS_10804 [Entomortierella parvispora]
MLLSLAILCTAALAAPTPVINPMTSTTYISDSDMETLMGPIRSGWMDLGGHNPELRDEMERTRQKERIAFRQFSEKVVSSHCTSTLETTLGLLDSIRDYVHDRLQVEESFNLLEPVLAALIWPLKMNDHFHFEVELTDEELKEERQKDKEEQEEERRNPSTTLPQWKKRHRERKWRRNSESNTRTRSWTEEYKPELLLRYRLRRLEKTMAVFPYVLKFAPDPVRQELEESGFVQKTRALREEVRSLLTCEGVQHVTVAQLKDKCQEGYESDRYMDRSAARHSLHSYNTDYRMRLFREVAVSRKAPTLNGWGNNCGLVNTTHAVNSTSAERTPENNRQQLKDQVVEDPVLFKTPEVQFVWTWEAIVGLWKATDTGHGRRRNPEVTALMFQEEAEA